jgi:superfamily I DNA/RNA helicase
VVVDEYQDFSLLETRFIGLLTERSPVLIAGDDDQALYGFKHASASHIRALAHDAEYSKFELPYCSRCTEVIVNAVHDVLAQAHARDLLPGRLDKPYCCYLPDKREDSERHPRIIYAYCTVERGNAPYIGRYVSARIAEIPEEEIRASQEGGYPTVLVTGPVEFVRRVHPVLVDRYPNAVLKGSSPTEIAILDGYRYLSRDAESRLGWRIVLYRDPCTDTAEVIRTALGTGEDLANLIPDDYRGRHLQIATLVDKVIRGEGLTDEEKATLVTATGLTFESIRRALHRTEDEDPETAALHQPEESALEPSIICTSLRGAKGLSASRVFIVGLNNGHFPRNPAAITDDEVCSLLVGLSRTRRQCYLVSCVRFGNFRLRPSIFLDWIRDRLVGERVDRNWIQAHTI